MMKLQKSISKLKQALEKEKWDYEQLFPDFARTIKWGKQSDRIRYIYPRNKKKPLPPYIHIQDLDQTAEDRTQSLVEHYKRYLCQRVNEQCNYYTCPHILSESDFHLYNFGYVWSKYGHTNPQQLHTFFKNLKQQFKIIQTHSFRQIMSCFVYSMDRLLLCSCIPFEKEELRKKHIQLYLKWKQSVKDEDESAKQAQYASGYVQEIINLVIKQYSQTVKIQDIFEELFYSFFGLFGFLQYTCYNTSIKLQTYINNYIFLNYNIKSIYFIIYKKSQKPNSTPNIPYTISNMPYPNLSFPSSILPSISISILTLLLLSFQTFSTIIITQPAITPFPKNQLQYYYANFGTIHYNKPMSYSLFISNLTLCGDTQQQSKIKQFTQPTYIVIKQGICSFPKKAHKAQSLGAQGIIFASKQIEYSQGNVILADDGTGRKIKITSLFISLQNYNKLSSLTNPKIKILYQLQQSQISNVNIFLSASGRSNYIFLRNFRPFYNKLSNKIKLNIIYHTIQCKNCLQTQCILQKTCCAFDMDNYQSNVGKMIVMQEFRQYKIFKYFQNRNQVDKWFQYMDKFDKKCDYNWLNSKQCSQKIQNQLYIQKLQQIDQFDTMMNWRRLQTKTGIISLPDISVNNFRHVQYLTAQNAYNMICQSLSEQISQCGYQQQKKQTNNRGGIIAAVVITCIIFIISGIFCYRKIIKKQITNDMSSRVNQLVAKYAAKVSEQKKRRKEKLMERMTEQL